MKIGIDCRLYSSKFTGIGRYVFELIKHLSDIDEKNEYIIFLNNPEFDSFEIPNKNWKKILINIPHYSIREQFFLTKKLNKYDLDLMYFPHFNVPVTYKNPFIVSIHDLTLHYYPYKEYHPKKTLKKQLQMSAYRYIMRKTLQNARHIISVSENTKKDILKEYTIKSEKITPIFEGVPEHFKPVDNTTSDKVKKKYGINKPYLLYTGVWRSHKNLLKLLKAFLLLLKQGKDIQMVFTGKIDPVYIEIPEFIKKHKLESHIRLVGFVSEDELIALNSAAEVFVFPSLYEGFGLPPLEAMRFGIPVACSNKSSLPEVCGDAAMYFDPENVHDMMHSISFLLDDQDLRSEMIEKGYQNIERFSWRTMTEQILDLFYSTCNNYSQN